MIRSARSLTLEAAAGRPERVDVDSAGALSRREATLRSGATTCLAGIAVIQAIELPSLISEGRQLAVMSIAAMAVCVLLGWALAAAPAAAASHLWRGVAALSVAVLAGWAVPHVFAVPGVTAAKGDWTSAPGAVAAVLAIGALGLTVAAVRPGRGAVRGLAVATAVAVAMAPGIAILLVGLGPGTAGGETVLASGGHIHSAGSPENSIVFKPGPNGGSYFFRAKATPHQSPVGMALIFCAALLFTYGAVGYLRGRTEPSGVGGDLEGRLA